MPDCLFEKAQNAAAFVRERIGELPPAAIVLGSGLSAFADEMVKPVVIPYSDIPHFPATTVPGHPGRLLAGKLASQGLVVLQGRIHHYEGHSLAEATFPVRLLQALGVRVLILTAAVGGIASSLRRPGTLVALTDHLNLMGGNPLNGPNDDRLGPRFLDLSEVYSRSLRQKAIDAAALLGIPLQTGVYAALPGPTYETPAEIRMLHGLGADVVGMSTVPEAIVARHAGMEVLGIAVVANPAAGLSAETLDHREVLKATQDASPTLVRLIGAFLPTLMQASSELHA